MDSTTIIVLMAFFALILIAAFLAFRNRSNVRIQGQGPGHTRISVDTSEPPPGEALVERARSREGKIAADNKQGGGATVRDAVAKQDIRATVSKPGSDPDPKG